jgi:eukaryotic translation initiation factor 2-alpha kinase 4
LKPSNIFIDGERNVKLGDFGLATRNRDLDELNQKDETASDSVTSGYDAIDDIRPLLGDPVLSLSRVSAETSAGESMTGGVGTTFYRAPEQEGGKSTAATKKSDKWYTIQADIFSLGVILFEMFHPPFTTYMERAETLTTLRGDKLYAINAISIQEDQLKLVGSEDEFKRTSNQCFPKLFLSTVPENAQRYVAVKRVCVLCSVAA